MSGLVLTGKRLLENAEEQRALTCKNEHQGAHRRVLCVCSAGLLRSPTAALVLSMPPFNFNTRAAGFDPAFALIPVDNVLLLWADEVVCMERYHAETLQRRLRTLGLKTPVKCLAVPDSYEYRHPTLMRIIVERYEASGDLPMLNFDE